MRTAIPALVALVAVAAAGCGGATDPAADGRIAVVASTNVGSVVAAVGGDDVHVTSLIADPAADPHSYADKPEDATRLADAGLVVYNGGGYDDFFAKLADATGTGARRIVAFDLSGHADGENEHVWYDLPTVKKVADRVAAELGAVAPDKKDTFTANAAAFDDEVDALAATVAQVPDGDVVATEPVARYLLDAAGLTDVTPPDFSEAIEEETDPPVVAVADTTDLITGRKVVALINNDQAESAVTNQLKDAAASPGVPVVDVSETLPPGVTDYVEWMTNQVGALAGALSGA